MEGERTELASILVHIASAFGCITNSIAVVTIKKCVNLHTSFGILCACLAANNCALLILNSVWYMLPDAGIFKTGSTASKATGMVGTVLWISGIRFHLLISFNRFIAIIFPFKRKKLVNAKTTSIGVAFVIIASIVQCTPLILVEDIWFCFDRSSMQWIFAQTDLGKVYWAYLINLSNTIEIFSVFIIDVITLLHLRLSNSKIENSQIKTTNFNSRAIEIRLYKQAFSQSLPLLITLVCFAFVTPQLSDDFIKFLTTTFVWHLAHGFDGLIIDLFHTRKDLFFKRKDDNRSIAASSFALTTTI